jgi:hypothetical protein
MLPEQWELFKRAARRDVHSGTAVQCHRYICDHLIFFLKVDSTFDR